MVRRWPRWRDPGDKALVQWLQFERFLAPAVYMSKSPPARYWTPNCFLYHVLSLRLGVNGHRSGGTGGANSLSRCVSADFRTLVPSMWQGAKQMLHSASMATSWPGHCFTLLLAKVLDVFCCSFSWKPAAVSHVSVDLRDILAQRDTNPHIAKLFAYACV